MMAFIDYEKAFELDETSTVMKALRSQGIKDISIYL